MSEGTVCILVSAFTLNDHCNWLNLVSTTPLENWCGGRSRGDLICVAKLSISKCSVAWLSRSRQLLPQKRRQCPHTARNLDLGTVAGVPALATLFANFTLFFISAQPDMKRLRHEWHGSRPVIAFICYMPRSNTVTSLLYMCLASRVIRWSRTWYPVTPCSKS